jgi:hypothetical protein
MMRFDDAHLPSTLVLAAHTQPWAPPMMYHISAEYIYILYPCGFGSTGLRTTGLRSLRGDLLLPVCEMISGALEFRLCSPRLDNLLEPKQASFMSAGSRCQPGSGWGIGISEQGPQGARTG